MQERTKARQWKNFAGQDHEVCWLPHLDSNQKPNTSYKREGLKPIMRIHPVGLEPTANGLEGHCSSNWAKSAKSSVLPYFTEQQSGDTYEKGEGRVIIQRISSKSKLFRLWCVTSTTATRVRCRRWIVRVSHDYTPIFNVVLLSVSEKFLRFLGLRVWPTLFFLSSSRPRIFCEFTDLVFYS